MMCHVFVNKVKAFKKKFFFCMSCPCVFKNIKTCFNFSNDQMNDVKCKPAPCSFHVKQKKMWVFVNLWAYICNLFFFDKSIRNDCFAESVSLFPWNKLKQKINKTDIIKTSVGAHEVRVSASLSKLS